MTELLPLNGKHLMFCGKPLIRENNVICYGDMEDKYFIYMTIISEKKNDKGNTVPDGILVQLLPTALADRAKIVKQDFKIGLYNAFDIGMAWLDRALAEK